MPLTLPSSGSNDDAETATCATTRVRALQSMSRVLGGIVPGALLRAIEQVVFEATERTGMRYGRHLRRITYNLSQRPDLITSSSSASPLTLAQRLLNMPPAAWHEGTPTGACHEAFRLQKSRTGDVKGLVEDFSTDAIVSASLGCDGRRGDGGTGGASKDEDEAGRIMCRRCGSFDLEVRQMQTRGADEAMTNFVKCKRCGQRFKM